MEHRDPSANRSDRAGNIAFCAALLIVAGAGVALTPATRGPMHPSHAAPSHPPAVHADDPKEAAATIAAPQSPPNPDAAPVLEPHEALAAFRLAPGLKATIAASEPNVTAPVCAAFDEDGRLWVAEMRTYMRDLNATGEAEKKNRILVLTDADGDGTFEDTRVFMDDLSLPRGIAPCFGGVLIIEPPSLIFCKDTDGDGRADVRQKLLDGFTGLDNPEHAANSLVYGLDNWYHLSQHNIEFRFDGTKVETRPTPTHGQWGLAMDDLGRLYTTPNSDPLLIDLAPKHYGARNRHQGGLAFLGRSIVQDKSVYPIHATPGVNRGYQKNVLREDKTLSSATAACGPSFYDSDAMGDGFRRSAFVCEPAGNAVKRYVFTERDNIPAGRNPYDKIEFLASTDERFRPVNTLVGPDGALYVLDMYRGIIQHKLFVTPYLREQILARELEAPVDRGRIYRVAGAGSPPGTPARLSKASTDELVRTLAHADQWWRLAAQRMLVERRATDAASGVRALARAGAAPTIRLHALWTLEGLGELAPTDIEAAAADASPAVRRAGVRLAERFLDAPATVTTVERMLDDEDVWVRVQAACSLGQLPEAQRTAFLVPVLKRFGADRFVRDAAVSGLNAQELAAIRELTDDTSWTPTKDARYVMDNLADCVLRTSDAARTDMVEFVAALASEDDPAADMLIGRIRVAQKLDSDKPRPISLSRAPARWIGAMGERFNTFAAKMGESEVYFDWPERPPVRRVAGTRPLTSDELARFDRGRTIYSQTCVSCHQGDGRGSSGQGPPLAASAIAEGHVERFASVLIHGLEGTWKLGDLTYEAAMPPTTVPGDDDLAAVMTFVRRSFGNAAEPVTAAEVARARAAHKDRGKSWTRDEVEKWAAPSN